MTSMFIIKKHNYHNKTSWYHVWRSSIDFVVSWTQRLKVTAKVEKKKAAAGGRRRPHLLWRGTLRLNGRKERFKVWQSQVMHLNIVSLACRFCILVANLIFLESQILLSSAREDWLVRNSNELRSEKLLSFIQLWISKYSCRNQINM